MDYKKFVINLEKHQTKDVNDSHINGELTVIWRNWDKIFPKNPEMVYVNTVNPKEIKGPHLHKNRTTYFYCVSGKITIVVEDKENAILTLSTIYNFLKRPFSLPIYIYIFNFSSQKRRSIRKIIKFYPFYIYS